MELPVAIEPLPEGRGFAAHLAAPFHLSVEAATAEEAYQQVAALLQRRLQQGLELRALHVLSGVKHGAEPGWLPDDELTRDWLQLVKQYRSECDEADRRRLQQDAATGEGTS
ncbi:MAG: hypothetical protein L0Z62_11045 [Gemmataceae bacterium]|nr:hypothetical protein [Gemmataceae bacterium]